MLTKSTLSPMVGYGLAAGLLLGTSAIFTYYGDEGGDEIEFARVSTASATYLPGVDSTPQLEAVVFGSTLTVSPGPTASIYGEFVFGDPAQDVATWNITRTARYLTDSAGADVMFCYPPNLAPGTYGYVVRFYHEAQVVVGDLDGSTNGISSDEYGLLTVLAPADPSIYLRGEVWPPWAARPDRIAGANIYINNDSFSTLPAPTVRITTDSGDILFTNGDPTRRSVIDFTAPSSLGPQETYYDYFLFETGTVAPNTISFTLSLLEGGPGSDVKRTLNTGSTFIGTSFDPNEKLGPTGIGPDRQILLGTMNYRINFENVETATADAQVVTVEDELTFDFEPGSFLFESFGWSNNVYTVSPPAENFSQSIDISTDLRVDVVGVLDTATTVPKATVTFTTIDKNTDMLPIFDGFLPPNDDEGIGEGFVTFQVLPDLDTPVGTVISNEALIFFDTNPPISTSDAPNSGPWTNQIADLPPGTPDIPLPADGSVNVPFELGQLSCSNPDGASEFNVYVWRASDPKPSHPTVEGLSQPVLLLGDDLDPNTQYRWQVEAANPWGTTPSTEWTFNTGSTGVGGLWRSVD
ncbi:MAG: hypothetical protein RLY93_19865 [Sumerlaeia bacterium]